MTSTRLETHPSLEKIEEFRRFESNMIYIKSPIMQGVAGLLIGSVWRVDYSDISIRLLTLNLLSHHEKVPLTPLAIPDRHLRAVRKIGAALFNVRRFDRLFFIDKPVSSTGYVVNRDDETSLFVDRTDAELYVAQAGEKTEIVTQPLTKRTTRNAQKNSADIRTEMLRLMTQVMTGMSALKQLKTLKERGVDPKELEKIWRDAHDQNSIPAILGSLLYE
ncbi:MAG: hypothetical protein E4H14_08260 [Candidatus Thorarchaeota archaeon]|nr:MAG: hypothetical protein E4H14_08260 [Candidatus Thorarchaeota archaeon]